MLGLAGKGEVEVDGVPGSAKGDLELRYGVGVQYQHPLHEFISLGGQIALHSWQTEAGDDANLDRNLLLDVSLVPALRYAVERDIELYLAVPVGLTLDFIGEDTSVAAGDASAEVGTGIGFNLALMPGVRFALSDGFGLLAEIGYSLHSFSHEVTGAVGALGASYDFDVTLSELAINLGVFFY